MKEVLMRILARFLWPLIEGSSVVVFNKESRKVRKIYKPRPFVRLLYLIAFQSWVSRYERGAGLQIACFRREIANYILRYSNRRCKVASCLGIELHHGQFALVTELIEGRQPIQSEVITVSRDITTLFIHAGLPTWSICPHHPRFQTNFIIDNEGIPVIIDLESQVPSIFVPIEELWDNILIGNLPPLDDIHFPKLWRFFYKETGALSVPEKERFRVCIEECERLTKEQKSREIRVWSRIVNLLLLVFKLRKE